MDTTVKEFYVHAATDLAVLVSESRISDKAWIPKSQVENDDDIIVGEFCELEVHDWILDDKGFL